MDNIYETNINMNSRTQGCPKELCILKNQSLSVSHFNMEAVLFSGFVYLICFLLHYLRILYEYYLMVFGFFSEL